MPAMQILHFLLPSAAAVLFRAQNGKFLTEFYDIGSEFLFFFVKKKKKCVLLLC